ncbi:MAG: TatD family hydrolase [bacterium]|nr:TatD family hydrolase [bacterium]
MKPDYFDIHSHLDFKDYDTDREEVIQTLKDTNIWTTTVGTELETSKNAVELAEKHRNLYATIGVHPADNHSEEFTAEYEELVKHPKVVAIGECGLDYTRLPEDSEKEKSRQKALFEQHIEFAIKHNKPLMIHCRDAYPDILAILESKKREYGDKLRGNFHFFTSPIETARQCLETGFSVSFTGPITFASQYEEVVDYVPLERMMAETDAPFASPVPFRGKRNNPLYVQEIVKKIAHIKKIELETVREQLVENSLYFFLINPLSG